MGPPTIPRHVHVFPDPPHQARRVTTYWTCCCCDQRTDARYGTASLGRDPRPSRSVLSKRVSPLCVDLRQYNFYPVKTLEHDCPEIRSVFIVFTCHIKIDTFPESDLGCTQVMSFRGNRFIEWSHHPLANNSKTVASPSSATTSRKWHHPFVFRSPKSHHL